MAARLAEHCPDPRARALTPHPLLQVRMGFRWHRRGKRSSERPVDARPADGRVGGAERRRRVPRGAARRELRGAEPEERLPLRWRERVQGPQAGHVPAPPGQRQQHGAAMGGGGVRRPAHRAARAHRAHRHRRAALRAGRRAAGHDHLRRHGRGQPPPRRPARVRLQHVDMARAQPDGDAAHRAQRPRRLPAAQFAPRRLRRRQRGGACTVHAERGWP